MAVLSQGQLQRLKEHKYAAEGRSLTEFIFQPFWNWVVTLMPLWVAPNLITISGLIINVFTCSMVLLYSPQAKSNDVPSYMFILCAVGLFLYQTLDAIDGKQARRTGTSSPMGELFDHGCDAVSTIFLTTSIACALSLGSHPNTLFFFFVNNVALFYLAHWQTYCSGKLIFGVLDVTEAQVEASIGYVLAGLFGPHLFLNKIPFLYNISYAKGIVILVGIGSLWYCSQAFTKIFKGGCGKNGTTVAQTSVLSPVVPFGIIVASTFYVFKHSADNIFVECPCLFMMMFGTCTAKLTCNLVVASMSKSPVDMLDYCMIGPLLLATYNYFGVQGILAMVGIPLPEYYVLLATFVFSVLLFIRYSVCICQEISKDFRFDVFKIPYKESGKKAE